VKRKVCPIRILSKKQVSGGGAPQKKRVRLKLYEKRLLDAERKGGKGKTVTYTFLKRSAALLTTISLIS